MNKEKTHAIFLALGGGYLIYLAYQLLEKYRTGTNEMPEAAFYASIGIFMVGGIGALIYAYKVYRASGDTDQHDKEKE